MRFSRAFVLNQIDERIASREKEYGFQSGWGWKRVEHRSTEVIVAFGEYRMLVDLREEFEA